MTGLYPNGPGSGARRMRDPLVYLGQAWTLLMDYFPAIVRLLLPLLPFTLAARLYTSPSAAFTWAQTGVTILLESLLTVTLIGVLPRMYDGEEVHLGAALQRAFQLWGAYLWAWLRIAVMILAGLFALIVPGVYLALTFSLFGYSLVLEDHPSPLARSRGLIDGHRLQLLLLIGIFMLYPMTDLLCGLIARQTGQSFLMAPFAFFDLLMLAWLTVVLFLVYLDLSAGDFAAGPVGEPNVVYAESQPAEETQKPLENDVDDR